MAQPVVLGSTKGKILTMWNKTLDPKSPDFKYSEPVVVATSDGYEDNDAIDPGLLLDPTWTPLVIIRYLFWIHSSYRTGS